MTALARVIALPVAYADDEPTQPELRLVHGHTHRRRPQRGHTADCPYPTTDPNHCGICRSERIAQEDR